MLCTILSGIPISGIGAQEELSHDIISSQLKGVCETTADEVQVWIWLKDIDEEFTNTEILKFA